MRPPRLLWEDGGRAPAEAENRRGRLADRKSVGTEAPARSRLVRLAGVESHGGKGRMVRSVGQLLRFQAQPGMATISTPTATRHTLVQKLPRVELDGGLVGPHLKSAPVARFKQHARQPEFARGLRMRKHHAVVITVSYLQLRIGRPDILTDALH